MAALSPVTNMYSTPTKRKGPGEKSNTPIKSPQFSSPSSARGTTDLPSGRNRREVKNIRVFLRVRPPMGKETADAVSVVPDEAPKEVVLKGDRYSSEDDDVPDSDKTQRVYSFERVFGGESTQQEVFDHVARQTVQDVFDGYHGVIFVYGQTGTGKTYTLCNTTPNEEGIVVRSIKEVFQTINDTCDKFDYETSVQMVQLYQEQFQDLLSPSNPEVQLRDDPELENGVYLDGATEHAVANTQACMNLYLKGEDRRAYGSTLMNEKSSRSHTLFVLNVHKKNPITSLEDNGDKSELHGRLVLVDLAGSERCKKTGSTGIRLNEAKHINTSLLLLGRVVHCLTEPNMNHVPYRDSKLTRYLQYSLSGNGKTSIVVTVGPSSKNFEETHGAILFGQRAMKVKQDAKVHTKVDYRALAVKLQKLLNEKNDDFRDVVAADYKQQLELQQERILELEDRLSALMDEKSNNMLLENQNIDLKEENNVLDKVAADRLKETQVLVQQNEDIETKLMSICVENEKLVSTNHELHKSVVETSTYVDQLLTTVGQSDEKITRADSKLKQSDKKIQQLEQMRAELTRHAERLQHQLQPLQTALSSKDNQNAKSSAEITTLTKELATVRRGFTAQLQQYEKDLNIKDQTVQQLQQELTETKKQTQNLQSEMTKELTSARTQFDTQTRQYNQQLNTKENAIQTLQQQLLETQQKSVTIQPTSAVRLEDKNIQTDAVVMMQRTLMKTPQGTIMCPPGQQPPPGAIIKTADGTLIQAPGGPHGGAIQLVRGQDGSVHQAVVTPRTQQPQGTVGTPPQPTTTGATPNSQPTPNTQILQSTAAVGTTQQQPPNNIQVQQLQKALADKHQALVTSQTNLQRATHTIQSLQTQVKATKPMDVSEDTAKLAALENEELRVRLTEKTTELVNKEAELNAIKAKQLPAVPNLGPLPVQSGDGHLQVAIPTVTPRHHQMSEDIKQLKQQAERGVELEKQVGQLQRELEEIKQRRHSPPPAVVPVPPQVDSQQLQVLQNQCQQQAKDLEAYKQQCQVEQAQMEAQNQQLKTQQQQLSEQVRALEAQKQQVATQQQAIQAQEQQLKAQQEKMQAQQQKEQEQEKELQALRARLASTHEQLSSSNQLVQAKDKELSSLLSELSSKSALGVSNLNENTVVGSLRIQLQSKEQLCEEQRQEIATLHGMVPKKDEEIDNLRQQLVSKESELAEKTCGTQIKEINDAAIKVVEQEKYVLSKENSLIKSELATIKAQLDAKERRISELQESQQCSREKESKMGEENCALRERVFSSEENRKKMIEDLDKATDELHKATEQRDGLQRAWEHEHGEKQYFKDELEAQSNKKSKKSKLLLFRGGDKDKDESLHKKDLLKRSGSLRANQIAIMADESKEPNSSPTDKDDKVMFKGKINKSRSGAGVNVVFTDVENVQDTLPGNLLTNATPREFKKAKARSKSLITSPTAYSSAGSPTASPLPSYHAATNNFSPSVSNGTGGGVFSSYQSSVSTATTTPTVGQTTNTNGGHIRCVSPNIAAGLSPKPIVPNNENPPTMREVIGPASSILTHTNTDSMKRNSSSNRRSVSSSQIHSPSYQRTTMSSVASPSAALLASPTRNPHVGTLHLPLSPGQLPLSPDEGVQVETARAPAEEK